MHNRLVGAPRM